MTTIEHNYQDICLRVAAACARVGRSPEEVKIIAVSKTVGPSEIEEACAAGIHRFAENRTTLFKERIGAFPQQEWHFIGTIQTNKIKDFAGRAALVHSVASERALRAIQARMELQAPQVAPQEALQEAPRETSQERQQYSPHMPLQPPFGLPLQPILIEVNISGEESKDGVTPAELPLLLETAQTLDRIMVKGLMTMAPISDEATTRASFRGLCALRAAYAPQFREAPNIDLVELSMGMSNDYEIAIEEGATLVRIGRALWRQ